MVGSALVRTAPNQVELLTPSRSELDFRDTKAVRSFLEKSQPDVVILAAAKVGGIEVNSKNHFSFLLDNLQIQNALIGGSVEVGIKSLIFLGSSCIYPKDAAQPIAEDSLLTGLLEPTNEGYAIAKIAGLRLVKAIFDERKLNYFSLMPTNLYGPHDNFDRLASHVPASLMRRFHEAKIKEKTQVSVWGSGQPKREFMHVDDLASACWYFLNKNVGGELINIGTGRDISISDFSKIMARIVGYKGEIIFDKNRPDGAMRKLLDTAKVASLGWQSRIDLVDGLASTYDWFVKSFEKGAIRGY